MAVGKNKLASKGGKRGGRKKCAPREPASTQQCICVFYVAVRASQGNESERLANRLQDPNHPRRVQGGGPLPQEGVV